MGAKDRKFVHSVSIAEFDQLAGDTLSKKYPSDFQLSKSSEEIAHIALPEGAHIHEEDFTYFTVEEQGKEDPIFYYGICYFRNKKDKDARRGAVQKSLVLISEHPYFGFFKRVLPLAMDEVMAGNGKKALKDLYETINGNVHKATSMRLFKKEMEISLPKLKHEEVEGVSLIDLIKLFKVDTMILWYGLLLNRKVLFVGQPAGAVGNCCLAAPLLVAPLRGFRQKLHPYVSLNDLSVIMGGESFIAGATNPLFESRTDWWDVLGSFTGGTVSTKDGLKITGQDREHIKNVISGIEDHRSEDWVRNQFKAYTERVLAQAEKDALKGIHKKVLAPLCGSTMLADYLEYSVEDQEEAVEKQTTLSLLAELKDVEHLSVLSKPMILRTLSEQLVDLQAIEELCDNEGVGVIASFLDDESSQTRKYATNVLANVALSIKGQLSILSGSVLSRIIDRLKNDKMTNVASAACYCLYKISTLYIGVVSLIDRQVVSTMVDTIRRKDQDILLKTRAASTILQVYRFCPTLPRVDSAPFIEEWQQSHDLAFRSTIVELLDLWGSDLPQVQPSEKMRHHIAGVAGPDRETKTQHTSYLLQALVATPSFALEFVLGNGLEPLFKNMTEAPPSEKLSWVSYAVLAIIVDFNVGRSRILAAGMVENALLAMENTNAAPIYLLHVTRFLEVACQHDNSAQRIAENDGASRMIQFIRRYCDDRQAAAVCIPALGGLRYVICD
mmetsp:Transcript_28056/g.71514  ORF Transcript_28056/g.71514 Transcript_28056/m.71514 type:complete len:726 (-) Transcript_28056:133-2310(-)